MIPIKLKLKNFLSYHDEVEIDFTSLHLACISGSNGAGKSSLLDAMVWALFGKARRNDDALIFNGEEHAVVSFEFEYEGKHYLVEREIDKKRPGKLFFYESRGESGWSTLTDKSKRDTDSLIRDTLRLDYDTFTNASFFLQGKADQFTQTKPGDRIAILRSILGLDKWKDYQERASQRRKAMDLEKVGMENQRKDAQAEIQRESEYKDLLNAAKKELDAEKQGFSKKQAELEGLNKRKVQAEAQLKHVNVLKQQKESSQKEIDEFQSRLQSAESEIQKHQQMVARAVEINNRYNELQEVILLLDGLVKQARRAQEIKDAMLPHQRQLDSERSRLENQLHNLEREKALVEQTEGQIPQKKAELETLQLMIDRNSAELLEEANLLASIHDLEIDLADKNAQKQASMATIREQAEREAELRGVDSPACPLCGQDLTPTHREKVLLDIAEMKSDAEAKIRLIEGDQQKKDQTLMNLQARLSELQELKTSQNELHRSLDKLSGWLEEKQKQISEWNKTGEKDLQSTMEALQTQNFGADSRAALKDLQADLGHLGYDRQNHLLVEEREKNLRSANQEKTELTKAQTDLEHTQKNKEQYQKEISQRQSSLSALTEAIVQATELLNDLEQGTDQVDNLQAEVAMFERKISELNQKIGAFEEKIKGVAESKTLLNNLTAKIDQHAAVIDQLKTLEKAFGNGGIPKFLIEQALPEIEEHANGFLERLSEGDMNLRFLTQKELKSRDALKETLDIQISDRNGVRDYDLYSGGESFRVNFALRLALSQVLAQRAGARLQTLVIDEGFGSQDSSGRSRLVEAIRQVQDQFALILIITHLEELKDSFPSRIEVEKTERGSTVKVL